MITAYQYHLGTDFEGLLMCIWTVSLYFEYFFPYFNGLGLVERFAYSSILPNARRGLASVQFTAGFRVSTSVHTAKTGFCLCPSKWNTNPEEKIAVSKTCTDIPG